MQKHIVVESLSYPDLYGYEDKVAVTTNGSILYHGNCSACPNPRKPWIKGGAPWHMSYGWISCGSYTYSATEHKKYGLWLVLDNGDRVPSRSANPNHGWDYVLTEVGVHRGWSDVWRGSAGCLTLPPDTWARFISLFAPGDTGKLHIVDYANRNGCAPAVCARAKMCPIYEAPK